MRLRTALSLALVACGSPATTAPPAREPAPSPAPADGQASDEATPPPSMNETFARLWLDRPAKIAAGVTLTLTSIVSETIEASPDDPESYPAGSGVTATVEVRGELGEAVVEFVRLSPGYQSREVVWALGLRFEVGVIDESAISVRVDRMGEPLAAAPTELRLARGRDLPLADGVTITLLGDTPEGALQIRYATPEGREEAQHPLGHDRRWRWRDFDFVVRSADPQGVTVELRRLERIPISVPPER
ncbi:MAG: hypothetical protein H6710_18290 [Myxococcales bacterium]|nr:hypothetical protein [Myxococcales bacterium]MCB9701250.1 hypothetical protein [Myxococcales bacterium]